MKERPILFSAPMVRAILNETKTQTRRIMRRQPTIDGQTGDWLFTYSDGRQEVSPIEQWIDIQVKLHCPYGKIGDRLWVRETFAKQLNGAYTYRADVQHRLKPDYTAVGNWRPSLFMPREASRILLEVTGIGVERLKDISESDAIAEGIEPIETGMGVFYGNYGNDEDGNALSPISSFRTLWELINGSESWAQNPYVWVIKFKVITI